MIGIVNDKPHYTFSDAVKLVQEVTTWCQIEPNDSNHEPYSLEVCRDKCKDCPKVNECIRWPDVSKVVK